VEARAAVKFTPNNCPAVVSESAPQCEEWRLLGTCRVDLYIYAVIRFIGDCVVGGKHDGMFLAVCVKGPTVNGKRSGICGTESRE
jgi:hypothetical protein